MLGVTNTLEPCREHNSNDFQDVLLVPVASWVTLTVDGSLTGTDKLCVVRYEDMLVSSAG